MWFAMQKSQIEMCVRVANDIHTNCFHYMVSDCMLSKLNAKSFEMENQFGAAHLIHLYTA